MFTWVGYGTCSVSPNAGFGFMVQPSSQKMPRAIGKGKKELQKMTHRQLNAEVKKKNDTNPTFAHKSQN